MCVVEGVARFLLDVVVDSQHLLGQRLGGRVEQRGELVPDAVGHSYAEGVEVAGDILHALKAVRLVRYSAGNGDGSAFQPPFQNLHHVFIVGPQLQHPGVQLLSQRENLQWAQLAPVDQSVQNDIPKLRDQGGGSLAVQLIKEPVPVPGGDEDVALPGLDGLLLSRLLWIFIIVRGIGGLGVVIRHESAHRVLAVVGHLPPVLLGDCFQLAGLAVQGHFQGCSAVDGVRHGLHHFRVAAKADGADDTALSTSVQDNGVSVHRQAHFFAGVIIGQRDQSAL